MNIRRAEESDVPQLETLFLRTRQQTFHWEHPDKFKLEDYRKATVGETIFVAEEGAIVGFLSVWDQETPPFIHHLFVSPEHQRKGIGTQLIRNLYSWLPPPYRLKCLIRNEKALSFYRKNGWIELDEGSSEDGDYFLLELASL